MAGTLKVGGVTLATHSDATAKVSLDSGLTFPAGHIIQTQYREYSLTDSIELTGTGGYTTLVDTGLSHTITPQYDTSKIYAQFVFNGQVASNANSGAAYSIFRDDSVDLTKALYPYLQYRGVDTNIHDIITLFSVDSPNTTNSVKYGLYFGYYNLEAVRIREWGKINIMLMEIKG